MNRKRIVVPTLFLMLMLFTSCSEKPVNNEVYCKAIDGLFSDNLEKNIVFVTSRGSVMDNTVVSGNIASTVTNKIDYSIKSINSSDECSTAEITFTYPDMVDITNQYISSDIDEDISSWLTTKLNGDYPQKQETIEVELTQNNDTYYLVVDEKLSNILTGGLIEYKMKVEKDVFNGLMGE